MPCVFATLDHDCLLELAWQRDIEEVHAPNGQLATERVRGYDDVDLYFALNKVSLCATEPFWIPAHAPQLGLVQVVPRRLAPDQRHVDVYVPNPV
ncbi:hypothetical protein AU210_015695 [Fusarium oxysporum f. sp. radicis-cucumerinum]|uniref:Uncharacterized protein n=1 Tax=Fusarium oxysporum f. sp. radicis-cucumerinum TaxID=327505 RepID=A0A2H3GC67_FUSOX|nr:hypothetical protein AU210_015695 [Fusarium oxysporum f. sp. radicis-cucumerinum]